jgi:hypothetical protein
MPKKYKIGTGGKSSVSFPVFVEVMSFSKNVAKFNNFLSVCKSYLENFESHMPNPYTEDQMLGWKTDFCNWASNTFNQIFTGTAYTDTLVGNQNITDLIFETNGDLQAMKDAYDAQNNDENMALVKKKSKKKSKMSGAGEYHDDQFYKDRIDQMRVQPKWAQFRACFPPPNATDAWWAWLNDPNFNTREKQYNAIKYYMNQYLDNPDGGEPNFDGLLNLTNATN